MWTSNDGESRFKSGPDTLLPQECGMIFFPFRLKPDTVIPLIIFPDVLISSTETLSEPSSST